MNYTLKTIFLLLSVSVSNAQIISTKFYNHNWKECEITRARFYSTVEKTDSGWFRNDFFISTKAPQMSALYKDSLCKIHNGYAIFLYPNGQLRSICNYINGNKDGLYLSYHNNGMMSDSSTFRNGKLAGTSISWFPNGFMSDSSFVKNDSIVVSVSWFDNGNPCEYGYFINKKKHGKWLYFHKNGQQACIEINDPGRVLETAYYNEDGTRLTDTSAVNREATFKGGIKDWSQYLSDKIYWPEEYKLTNTDTANVITTFTIDEDGKVTDYFMDVPYHPLIDRIAIDALRKCPAWKPALDHNRRVKAYRRQPLTFIQSHD